MNRAIEVAATVENSYQIRLDEPLPEVGSNRVRVIVMLPPAAFALENEITSEEAWLHAAADSEAFAFLADPAEDIYSPEDGQPFQP